MRVLSYNILDGGKGREQALGDVIESQRPDVVAIAEADEKDVIESLARRLNMDFILAPADKGAVALLSRFLIRDSINHGAIRPHLQKGFLEASVADSTGAPWTCCVLHFHAHALETDERTREVQLEQVLQATARLRNDRVQHLLMGDFNSISPVQQINPAKVKKSTREEWEKNGNQVPRRVIQRLLDEGYVDTLHAVDAHQAATRGSFSTECPGQRVDFIFAWGMDPSRIQSAWIVHNDVARKASDHYPVAAEIR